MKSRGVIAAVALLSVLAAASSRAATPDGRLQIFSLDVEGGLSILVVTPQGKTIVIDSGWPTGAVGEAPYPPAPAGPSSAERIVAAIKALGLNKIDYMITTHYHIDHVGGLANLVQLIPIDTFVDHGANREEGWDSRFLAAWSAWPLFVVYEKIASAKKRIVMEAGDVLRVDDLTLTAIAANGKASPRPVAGAGATTGCAPVPLQTEPTPGIVEDRHALGLVGEWGDARILVLSDSPAEMVNNLMCPRNLIGTVDFMVAPGHGNARTNTREFADNIRPRVVITNSGSAKGNIGPTVEQLTRLPYVQGVYQMHFATNAGPNNVPQDQIANLDGPDGRHALNFAIDKNGDVTVTNPRTGTSKPYPRTR